MTSTRRSLIPRMRPALARESLISSALIVVAIGYVVATGNLYWKQILLVACLYLIVANGLNILRSQAEQMSFGQGAVMSVAGYVTALATAVWEWSGVMSAVAGLAAGMLTGLVLSLPSLRVQGYYLGFVTMAGALALPDIYFLFKDTTQAVTGVNVLPSAINDPITGDLDWLTVVIVVGVVLSVLLVGFVRSSLLGRQMKLAGTSPEAAATLGLRSGALRLQAFAIASFCASVAGVLYIGLILYIAPGSFTLSLSILLYFVVIIGGPGTIAGPLAGVVLLYVIPDGALADLLDYRLLVYGVIAFLVMFFIPDGIVGGLLRLIRRFRPASSAGGVISLEPVLENFPPRRDLESRKQGPLLVVDDVTRSFGSVQALRGASVTVCRGELHAIVGPNGSGKTTLLNAISGLVVPDAGRIEFDGSDITSLSATGRARRGLARTFQTPRILPELSVWENIDCGARTKQTSWVAESLADVREEWDAIGAGLLPHGQRRFLEVLRVLHRSPQLLALDEPAAGLSRAERAEFGRLLRNVVGSTGATVLMVEHDLDLVWSIADVISVVDGGRVIAAGTPAELRHLPEIAHLFTGVTHVEG